MSGLDDPNGGPVVSTETESVSLSGADLHGIVALEALGTLGGGILAVGGFRTTQVAAELSNSLDKLSLYGSGTLVALAGTVGMAYCSLAFTEHAPQLGHTWADSYREWRLSKRASRQQGSDTVQ